MNLYNLGPNQEWVTLSNGAEVLFSHSIPVAAYIPERFAYVRTSAKHSATTRNYINAWLGGMSAEEVEQSVLDALVARYLPRTWWYGRERRELADTLRRIQVEEITASQFFEASAEYYRKHGYGEAS